MADNIVGDNNDILAATTIAAFLEALNARYDLGLLTHFPSGSPYSDLWAQNVRVQEGAGKGILFTASTGPVSVFSFLPRLKTMITVKVTTSGSEASGPE